VPEKKQKGNKSERKIQRCFGNDIITLNFTECF